jgi:hypothetical protein
VKDFRTTSHRAGTNTTYLAWYAAPLRAARHGKSHKICIALQQLRSICSNSKVVFVIVIHMMDSTLQS